MMHPCPYCHSRYITMVARVVLTRRLIIRDFDTIPAEFDYEIHEEHDNDLDAIRVACDQCGRNFTFDLDLYQELWPTAPDACTIAHEAAEFEGGSCAPACPRCAWEFNYSAPHMAWEDLRLAQRTVVFHRRR